MDFYHSWFYESVLNTKGFVWFIVLSTFVLNFIAPVVLWIIFQGRQKKRKTNE